MKKFVSEFMRRGMVAGGFGPIILAIVYLSLYHNGVIETLTVEEVCKGIFSLTALAFLAGGMNALYQVERLPLMPSILIHGVSLYIGYLVTYRLNNWMEGGTASIMFFTVIFVVGYVVIWVIIYFVTKRNTGKVNAILQQKQQRMEEK